ncbi:hypothetical protein CsatB_012059 [Cannabis sativa]
MANSNIKTLYLVFMISLVITFSIAESRLSGKFAGKAVVVDCSAVHGVEDGDTCFSVTQGLQLAPDFFSSLNPNLNCDALFVGQWLCVDGTLA